MRHWLPSVGLLGQVVAILLLTMVIEFGVSTLLYERASEFSVRDDEARRLAEHLVISRRLLEDRTPAQRPALAHELTTERYEVQWDGAAGLPPAVEPALDPMRRQIVEWEPTLRTGDLRLRLISPGRSSKVRGALRLRDGSWLHFRTLNAVARLDFAFERILLGLVPAIALMVLGGLMLRRALRPLRRLAEAADRVGHDPVGAVPEDGPREVRRLVGAFNRMQARIGALIEARTQSLAAVGHDLRTPLARLRLRTEAIASADTREAIGHDISEMEAMIASLLAFLSGDSDPEKPSALDLAVLCATLVDDATDRGHVATYIGPDHFELRLRRLAIKRALTNLIDNALKYGQCATVELVPGDGIVTVRVIDNGPGVPEEELAHILEPFVRLDPARGRDTIGFGLGLPIAVQAIKAEGGTLTLANHSEDGLVAIVVLPITQLALPDTKRYGTAAVQKGASAI
ncbi:ATP-binding protein [Sphingomonas mucosissima]|uniref:histidine kinase n=1 Tax=Sphingomonas mucosissima TaxID=370959 RepID=A0A245ZH03_9SPHN|nr:ATP-binding protein [Sphingomonas mucosissima]OWK29031.1 osmolarity sensor protein EnvZ [Sphingomonas mucosissima]